MLDEGGLSIAEIQSSDQTILASTAAMLPARL